MPTACDQRAGSHGEGRGDRSIAFGSLAFPAARFVSVPVCFCSAPAMAGEPVHNARDGSRCGVMPLTRPSVEQDENEITRRPTIVPGQWAKAQ